MKYYHKIYLPIALLVLNLSPFGNISVNAQTYYTISTFAGTGTYGYTGDSGLATAAKLKYPDYVTTDKRGNVYICDNDAHSVRKVDVTTGIIYTIAGNDTGGFSGDGGLAIHARMHYPYGINFGVSGDDTNVIFIADAGNNRIRKVSAAGIITTIAGTGVASYTGDGSSAMSATIYSPAAICADRNRNLYIADEANNAIRKIDHATGYISTIAGTGVAGYTGDGGLATLATLNAPTGMQIDNKGNIYFSDTYNNVIRRIDSATGIITTVAGNGFGAGTVTGGAYSGDSGLATAAELNWPCDVQVDTLGNIFICDQKNNRIRKVDAATHIITTIAGTGVGGKTGDGGLATLAKIWWPTGIRLSDSGIIYISDWQNSKIRKLTPHDTSVGVGTSPVLSKGEVVVWPNPVKENLTLSLSKGEGTHFVITNLSGRTLLQGKIYSSKQTIDVSRLQAGVYLIQVINKEGLKQTVKVVKE